MRQEPPAPAAGDGPFRQTPGRPDHAIFTETALRDASVAILWTSGFAFPAHSHVGYQVAIPLGPVSGLLASWQPQVGPWRDQALGYGKSAVSLPRQDHSLSWVAEAGMVLISLQPSLLERFTDRPLEPSRLPEGGAIHDLLLPHLARELDAERRSSRMVSALLAESVAVTVANRLVADSPDSHPPGRPVRPLEPVRCARVLDYVAAHLERNLSLSELASVAGLSPFHFARSFRQAVGQSPYQSVLVARVARVRTLLVTTDLPLVEIAPGAWFQ